MKVVLGADAGGFKLKEHIKRFLADHNGIEIVDLSPEPAKDFVESSLAVADYVLEHDNVYGILFDEYGAGSFMSVTKVKGVVAAEVSEERTGYMTRGHNNATIITLGEGIVGARLAESIVEEFLQASYDGGRHQVRVDMLNAMG